MITTDTDGVAKIKRIGGKVYKLAGVDLRQDELNDLKLEGFSVRNFYNKMYRESYTYIHPLY